MPDASDKKTGQKSKKRGGKRVILNNRSDKPNNIVEKEYLINDECSRLEAELPAFLKGYFSYLKVSMLPMSRLEYLKDLRLFMIYLAENTDLTSASDPKGITLEELGRIRGRDVNEYIEYCRNYSTETESAIHIYTNDNKRLARRKSAVSVFFKYLYREELISENITDQFNPIKVQGASQHEIKAMQDDEVMIMLDAVSTGEHLTEKERQYWEKTKKRDKAILVLFLTYGLRLSELQQLNVSSFNFSRGEFKIYRKRNKESVMPLNNRTVLKALREYLEQERPSEEKIKPGHEDALFLSLQGRRMTERSIRELVKKYTSIGMSTARSSGYSPHKLRATAATSLIARGNSIFDVQALLDHEHVATTQLYAAHKKNTKRDLIGSFEWDDEFDTP